MTFIDWLANPDLRGFLLPALAAGVPVVLMCSVLSVLVVIKRLAFVGQGVAHSAFGGVGVAALLAAVSGAPWAAQGSAFELGVIVVFCIVAALGMASVGDRHAVRVDTGIGVFLVASMALGALLIEAARALAITWGHRVGTRSWESVLFGSILTASWGDAAIAGVVSASVVLVLVLARRPLLFYISDETSAEAFGVPTRLVRAMLMILLALATVVAMRLTGVVLSSAMLILPGAAALKLSTRLVPVMVIAMVLGLAGLLMGLALALQLNVQAGPCVVLVLTLLFGASWGWSRVVAGGARGVR
jgi:ABC-type Mn2+/Zn2+ transport system permease subunit